MSDMVRPTAHEETRAVGGSALLALEIGRAHV